MLSERVWPVSVPRVYVALSLRCHLSWGDFVATQELGIIIQAEDG